MLTKYAMKYEYEIAEPYFKRLGKEGTQSDC